jgi:ClpP class serine protease
MQSLFVGVLLNILHPLSVSVQKLQCSGGSSYISLQGDRI